MCDYINSNLKSDSHCSHNSNGNLKSGCHCSHKVLQLAPKKIQRNFSEIKSMDLCYECEKYVKTHVSRYIVTDRTTRNRTQRKAHRERLAEKKIEEKIDHEREQDVSDEINSIISQEELIEKVNFDRHVLINECLYNHIDFSQFQKHKCRIYDVKNDLVATFGDYRTYPDHVSDQTIYDFLEEKYGITPCFDEML